MSYVERAFYQYVKNIFTSGFRVLFSKKYLFYTIAFCLISVTSTVFYLIGSNIESISADLLKDIGSILIGVELAFAVTYVFFGLFFSRYPAKYWGVPAFLTAAGVSVLVYFVPAISPYIAAIGYLGWILVSIFLTFSLSRNFWGNRIFGSVMFLGKKADEGSVLFSSIVFILSLVNLGMTGYLIYNVIINFNLFLLITSVFSLLAIIIVNIIVFKLGKKDDVFYTILAFFYVIASFTLWKLTFYTSAGSLPSDNIGSVLVALFFIFYTVSNYAKKIKKIEKETLQAESEEIPKSKEKRVIEVGDIEIERIDEEEEEKWALLNIPRSIGPLGILMTVMGLILSYHVTYLQFLTGDDIFSEFFLSKNDLVGIKDKFSVILLTCLLIFFLLNYLWSEDFRRYGSPTLYRFEFLPPYDELVERIERVRKGEDSWKQYANMLIKEGVKAGAKSTAKKVFVDPSKKVAGAIGGAYTKSKEGVTKGFNKVFKRKDKKKKR
ncbi:MAG: hypothetical protein KGD64_08190 [Candidatus Heimdallarchaeota archaeon]|nr:hypothetical protein [Candidatus Heimdallarchaeota archaeon]